MKHGTKPTVRQCKILQAKRLKPEDWMIERETPEEMVIMHRYGNSVRTLTKKKGDDTYADF